jgi:hypothetical protein
MTEDLWQSSPYPDPPRMVEFLLANGKSSDRKLRLFACASCRSFWDFLKDPRLQRAVEVTEDYADGQVALDELISAANSVQIQLDEAAQRCHQIQQEEGGDFTSRSSKAFVEGLAGVLPQLVVHTEAKQAAQNSIRGNSEFRKMLARLPLINAGATEEAVRLAAETAFYAENIAQASILREIFGNPVRPLPPLLTVNNGLVAQLARAAYDDRILPEGRLDNARLAVLADALGEAGFEDADLLSHLRQPEAVHVRGCAVVDWLLNRS